METAANQLFYSEALARIKTSYPSASITLDLFTVNNQPLWAQMSTDMASQMSHTLPSEGGILKVMAPNGKSRKLKDTFWVQADPVQSANTPLGTGLSGAPAMGMPATPGNDAATFYQIRFQEAAREVNELRQHLKQATDKKHELEKKLVEVEGQHKLALIEKEKSGGLAGPNSNLDMNKLMETFGPLLGAVVGGGGKGGDQAPSQPMPDWVRSPIGNNLGHVAQWLQANPGKELHDAMWYILRSITESNDPSEILLQLQIHLQEHGLDYEYQQREKAA